GRGSIKALVTVAEVGEGEPFAGVGGLDLALEDRGELAVQFEQALGLLKQACRRVTPAEVLRAEFVAALERGDGGGELPLEHENLTQDTMSLGVVLLEGKGPAEGGLRLLVPAVLAQDDAQVVVGIGVVFLEFDGSAEGGLRFLVPA